jgi:glutaredoxin
VTSPGCADCSAFERTLDQVAPDFPGVDVRAVDAATARGLALSLGQGILRFPVIVLDNEVLAIESIAESDLRSALALAVAPR